MAFLCFKPFPYAPYTADMRCVRLCYIGSNRDVGGFKMESTFGREKSHVRHLIAFFLVFVFVYGRGSAQAECPADVLLALARANAACSETERNQACYGNGEIASGVETFAAQGDTVGIEELATVQLNSAEVFSVMTMKIQANLLESQPGRNLTLLAFGDVTLENRVPLLPTVTVEATGSLNVRMAPDIESDIIETLPLRATLIANGRAEAGGWLRVLLPGSDRLGWVSLDVVRVTGDINTLYGVTPETPYLRPYQVFSVTTGRDDARCAGTPESGLLLQAPTEAEAVVTVNDVRLRLRGTLFLQADETMTFNLLDGQMVVESGYAPAGSRVRVVDGAAMAAEPFDPVDLAGLPVNNLTYRVQIPSPATESAIADFIAAALAAPTATPDPVILSRQQCRRTTLRAVTVWAGPGTFYEVLRDLARDTRVDPVFSTETSAGEVWWQLRTGGWLRASNIESTEACGVVPGVEVVQPPRTNRLSMETCEFFNGPLRAGQQVRIEFVDGGWPMYEEALAAPRIDPGRITISRDRIRVSSERPVEVAEDRWYRTFYGYWTAQPGTYRIESQRLSYILNCDVTVPVG